MTDNNRNLSCRLTVGPSLEVIQPEKMRACENDPDVEQTFNAIQTSDVVRPSVCRVQAAEVRVQRETGEQRLQPVHQTWTRTTRAKD